MTNRPHILVVDDNKEIRNGVRRYLEKNGMRVSCAGDAEEMDAVLSIGKFHLMILDVMMPGEDGISVCQRMAAQAEIPILMLTALGEENDRIIGLEVGADDYLAKPFNPRELLARIKSILRRTTVKPELHARQFSGRRISFANWTLDADKRMLTDDKGHIEDLTTAELNLLLALLERPRMVINRDQLLELTTGRTAQIFDRTIDNQISRLRRKIEINSARPRIITTVRSAGYCLAADVTEVD